MPTPDDDRFNGLIFTLSYACIYFAAPVVYIGIVQAGLSDKLGASAAIANLPASTYSLGQVAPLFFSWLIPHRLERTTVVTANLITALGLAAVCLTLILPLPDGVRIAALSIQGLFQGLSGSTSHVFMIQCLGRGTTAVGRANALRRTFTITPIAAVAGSLLAQYVLNPGLPGVKYPWDFALLYGIGFPCILGVAMLSSRYRFAEIPEEPRQPLGRFLAVSIKSFFSDPALARVWIAYLLFYMSLGVTSNLSLYAKEALGRDPTDFSGITLAIRFGCKAIGGLAIGWIAVRHGFKVAALACMGLLAASGLWAWAVPGFPYLLSVGLLGAGELGGMYIPNLVATLSSVADGPRNLAINALATPVSSFAPVLHGWMTDRFGFASSFLFDVVTAIAGGLLIFGVKRKA